jgi:hypothetical protein
MSQEPRLDVVRPQGLFQQGIVQQIDLSDGQVIRGSPIPVEQLQLVSLCALVARARQLHAGSPFLKPDQHARRPFDPSPSQASIER